MSSLLRDIWRFVPGMAASLFIGAVTLVILILPDWARDLANASAGSSLFLRFVVALGVNAVLIYFYIVKPLTHLRRARSAKGLVVQGRGVAYLDPESARQQIFLAVSQVPDVVKAEASVTNEMGRADVTVNVLASHAINGVKKKQDIRREIRKTLMEQLGVSLAHEPVINLRLTASAESAPQAISPDLMKTSK